MTAAAALVFLLATGAFTAAEREDIVLVPAEYARGGCGADVAYLVLRMLGQPVEMRDLTSLVCGDGETSLGALQQLLDERGLHTCLDSIRGDVFKSFAVATSEDRGAFLITATGVGDSAHFVVLKQGKSTGALQLLDGSRGRLHTIRSGDWAMDAAVPAMLVSNVPIAHIPRHRYFRATVLVVAAGLLVGGILGALLARLEWQRTTRSCAGALLLSLLALSFASGCGQDSEGVYFDKGEWDFGPVARSTVVHHTFRLFNRTSDVVSITKTRGTCLCTKPELSAMVIPPGGEIQVAVQFDVSSRGRQNAIVFLETDHPEFRILPLRLLASATEALTAVPERVALGTCASNRQANASFSLRAPFVGEVGVPEAICLIPSDSRLICTVARCTNTIHERIFRCDVATQGGLWEALRISESVTVYDKEDLNQSKPLAKVAVFGTILPDYVLTPEAVFVENATVGITATVTTIVKATCSSVPELVSYESGGVCGGVLLSDNDEGDSTERTAIIRICPNTPGFFSDTVSIRLAGEDKPLFFRIGGFAEALPDHAD